MKGKKLFLLLMITLSLMLVFSACDNGEEQDPVDVPAPSGEATIANASIWHIGMENTLDLGDEEVSSLLESMLAVFEDRDALTETDCPATAQDLQDIATTLKIVFNKPYEFMIGDTSVSCDWMSFSLSYTGADDDLYTNLFCYGTADQEKETTASVLSSDDALALLESYVAANCERIEIAETVELAGYSLALTIGEGDEIDDARVGQLLYRSLAVYHAAMNHSLDSIYYGSTYRLKNEIDACSAGEAFDLFSGADILLQLDNYLDYGTAPSAAEVSVDGHTADYCVTLTLDETTKAQVYLLMQEGAPYVDSFVLVTE